MPRNGNFVRATLLNERKRDSYTRTYATHTHTHEIIMYEKALNWIHVKHDVKLLCILGVHNVYFVCKEMITFDKMNEQLELFGLSKSV